MAIFNWLPQMPFTDNHQLDLDWLISKYKKLEDDEATIQESLEGAEAAKEGAEAAASDAANSATAAAGSATAAAGSAEDAADTAEIISDSLNQIAVNTSRINNLVANAGDTDNNAELLDIRVGANAYTYDAAGNAVRSIDDLSYQHGDMGHARTDQPGYYNAFGQIWGPTTNQEKSTNSIPVVPGDRFNIDLKYSTARDIWCAVSCFDNTNTFIERVILLNVSGQRAVASYIVPDNTYYIQFSWRSYGETNNLTITRKTSLYDLINTNKNTYNYGRNVKSVAHKGFSIFYPENTAPAFIMAAVQGFDAIETDIRLTSDGVPVCLHDETINRTARNADGSTIASTVNIADITYEQALAYDFGIWRGQEFAGTKIPTLAQFIKICKDTGREPYIEIKVAANMTQTAIENIADIVNNYGMFKKSTWISINTLHLQYVENHLAGSRLGIISADPLPEYLNTLTSITDNGFIDAGSVSETFLNAAKAAQIPVELYVFNNVADYLNMNPYISGVTSDWRIVGQELYKHTTDPYK